MDVLVFGDDHVFVILRNNPVVCHYNFELSLMPHDPTKKLRG